MFITFIIYVYYVYYVYYSSFLCYYFSFKTNIYPNRFLKLTATLVFLHTDIKCYISNKAKYNTY